MITQFPRIPVPANAVPDVWIYSSSTDQKYALGTLLELPDGRRFRYALNGGVILYKALMAQSRAVVTGWQAITQTAKSASVGDQVIPTLTTTTNVAGDWDEGWYIVEGVLAGAIGDMYKIVAHTVHATAQEITIEDVGGVRTALDASQVATLQPNIHSKVIVMPSTATGIAVGMPLVDIPINYFGWLQTRGEAPYIQDTGDNTIVGEPVGYPTAIAVPGAGGLPATTDHVWGICINEPSADAKAGMIYLTLE